MVRLSGGYEERAEAVLARLARPGQAGAQVSTSQAPPGGARPVRLAKLEQRRIASMSARDGLPRPLQPARDVAACGGPAAGLRLARNWPAAPGSAPAQKRQALLLLAAA